MVAFYISKFLVSIKRLHENSEFFSLFYHMKNKNLSVSSHPYTQMYSSSLIVLNLFQEECQRKVWMTWIKFYKFSFLMALMKMYIRDSRFVSRCKMRVNKCFAQQQRTTFNIQPSSLRIIFIILLCFMFYSVKRPSVYVIRIFLHKTKQYLQQIRRKGFSHSVHIVCSSSSHFICTANISSYLMFSTYRPTG